MLIWCQEWAAALLGTPSWSSRATPGQCIANSDSLCAAETFELGQSPTTKEAQGIADELYSEFVSEDVDKVSNMLATRWSHILANLPMFSSAALDHVCLACSREGARLD